MALRALKTDEEAAAIPLDQPVLVELPGGIDDEPEVHVDPKAGKTEVQAEPDPEVKKLKEQYEATIAAQKVDTARLEKERNDALALARQREDEARRARQEQAGTEHELVTTGLAGAQAEVLAAKGSYKAAMEAGDFGLAADAQERLARAAQDVRAFERAGAELADRDERRKANPTVERQPSAHDINQQIEMAPQLLPKEREWIKAHPETWTDRRMNVRLEDGYNRAVEKGLTRGTTQYFEFLDQHMGFAQQPPARQEERDADVQAPPSRNDRGGDGRPTGGRITLSPEQREIAKSLGVSDIEYARQVAAFDAARKADPDKYR